MKSTTNATLTADEVVYDLDVRAYNVLRRATHGSPVCLVLFVMPPDQAEWLAHSEDRLELRGCAYWLSLRREPAVPNTTSIRIRIPRENQFTPAALARIDNGSDLATGGRMKLGPVPTTAQIRAYLSGHDWRFGWTIGSVGAMYVHRDLSTDGNPITVFVPASEAFNDYTQRVLDIGDTLKVLERRDRDTILADMLATEVAPTPRTPPVPVS